METYFCFSDGLGRSGTFAALCSVLERVKTEQVVDIFQTIKALRIQRPGLVKNVVWLVNYFVWFIYFIVSNRSSDSCYIFSSVILFYWSTTAFLPNSVFSSIPFRTIVPVSHCFIRIFLWSTFECTSSAHMIKCYYF